MGFESPVVIRKHGFLSALVFGIAAVICVLTLSAAGVTIYGMKMVNDRIKDVVSLTPETLGKLLEWQKALPPALADAINDERAPEYRDQLDTSVELVRDAKSGLTCPVVEVKNNGDQLVSLLTLRIVVEDEYGVPLQEFSTYAATPVTVDSDWAGPLLPGSVRRMMVGHVYGGKSSGQLKARYEVCDVRIWKHSPAGRIPLPAESSSASDTGTPVRAAGSGDQPTE